MTASSLYLRLRRDLQHPPARAPGEAARIPIEGRSCAGKVKRGKALEPCRSTHYHQSRSRGPICAGCGRGWPTRIVIESVRGSRMRVPREREMDLAAELGRIFAGLPLWERRVYHAWELRCLACDTRVPHQSRRWRHVEVASHLRTHHPRASTQTAPWKIQATYEAACDRVAESYAAIERAYCRGVT